jgi:hypothetical protein
VNFFSKDDLGTRFGRMLYSDRRSISRRNVEVTPISEWKILLLTRRVGRRELAIEVLLEVFKETG